MDISPVCAEQVRLFTDKNHKHVPLMQSLDHINEQMGRQTVRLAVQSAGKRWKMRQLSVSKSYTTKLSDIITIYNRPLCVSTASSVKKPSN